MTPSKPSPTSVREAEQPPLGKLARALAVRLGASHPADPRALEAVIVELELLLDRATGDASLAGLSRGNRLALWSPVALAGASAIARIMAAQAADGDGVRRGLEPLGRRLQSASARAMSFASGEQPS